MKLIAVILATLVLYLSIQQPVLSARIPVPEKKDCNAKRSCSAVSGSCKKEKPAAPEKEKPGGCCELFFCNPFGACCSYMPSEGTQLTATRFFIQTSLANPVNENFLSSYIKDVWHPPKMVAAI